MPKFLFALLIMAILALAACGKQPAGDATDREPVATVDAAEECVIKPPAEPMACTMEWNPVCGCNGVTYGNACGARAAGVSDHTEGACEEERAD